MTALAATVLVEQRIGDVLVQPEAGDEFTLSAPTAAEVVIEVLGPVSGAAALRTYEHVQSPAAATWIVNHNLGRRPAAVSVRSPGGREVTADVLHVSVNQLVVNFAGPTVGSVFVQ